MLGCEDRELATGARLTNASRADSLPLVGMGWGVVRWGIEVPHLPTPTRAPSPQGGGEEPTATSNLNSAPIAVTA
jgi:hypothetical protein